ncbi:MAG: hypothetical protein V3T05_00860, partial [Myxococcota bacterium]
MSSNATSGKRNARRSKKRRKAKPKRVAKKTTHKTEDRKKLKSVGAASCSSSKKTIEPGADRVADLFAESGPRKTHGRVARA